MIRQTKKQPGSLPLTYNGIMPLISQATQIKQHTSCPVSIWSMRSIMTKYGIYDSIFKAAGDEFIKIFDPDTSLQRVDSVHIFSNMKHLGRIGIFTKGIRDFLINLKRRYKSEFKELDPSLRERCLKKAEESAFSPVKPSESAKTLQMVAEDLFFLINRFSSHRGILSMKTYDTMTRILKEQCITEQDETTNEQRVSLKANKDIPSDSLRNPSDPDAGYSGHKGKGYQVQTAETYSREEGSGDLSLITCVAVRAAHESDAAALMPYIEATEQRGVKPTEAPADTLCGSDDNHRAALEKGVDLISPGPDRQKKLFCTLTDFSFDKDGFVSSCPESCQPIEKTKKKDRFTIAFASKTCAACPRADHCPVKPGKKGLNSLRYNEKNVRLAQRRAYERSDDFKDKYRFRAGVEATMSQLDRRTGIRHLRVRGMKAVRFAATMKATALNIIRAAAYKKRRNKGKNPSSPSFGGLIGLILIVKEHFHDFLDKIKIAKVTSPTF
ncbi:MAG: hypothetical protein D3906_10760 [Candidatus Electrothrix sp. AUS1_2]|nr:hypothetical protein [Candidatus Electrothrix sp. AUS1_2]